MSRINFIAWRHYEKSHFVVGCVPETRDNSIYSAPIRHLIETPRFLHIINVAVRSAVNDFMMSPLYAATLISLNLFADYSIQTLPSI